MGLLLHRASRADRLVAGLGAVLATPPADTFATEIVAVPTRGVERWLAQSLSHLLGTGAATDGVCAGIDFPSPERLVGDAVSPITGIEPRSDPWHPRRAVWALLSVIDAGRHQEWAEPLWRYLADREPDHDLSRAGAEDEIGEVEGAGRRYATAFHLAELLAGYAGDRPQMIMHWLAGRDTDGGGRPLPATMAWQAELLRRLRVEIGVPGPAERLPEAAAQLAADPSASTLPGRLSVFGPTRLSHATLTVLAALAHHREVHLWLPHASPALWQQVSAAIADRPAIQSRSDDPTADLPRHRLLGYLGRDAREFQVGLSRLDTEIHDQLLDETDERVDDPATAPAGGPLLRRLQDDLAADRPLRTADTSAPIAADDHSIGVHAAHGPDRQVEVLRELVLGLLADDPTLEPRDIMVMCPDIETFAPLVSAAFGAQAVDADTEPDGHPGHQLRVRLADRSLRQLNPLLQVLSRLFDLAESRIEASAIVDLCGTDPVATQFDLRAEDLLRLRELVARSGVRWGLDPRDRQRFAMGDFAQNTWAAGLDRMLLGVAMDEDGEHFIGTTLPMDDIDAGDVELVGRLAEVVDRLNTVIASFDRRQSLRSWIDACRTALDLLTAVPSNDNWQLAQAYGELTRIGESAAGDSTGSGHRRDDLLLTRREARAVLSDLFAGRPSRANFRTGTLTVATLMPMRSVPHRVVCLLGLDDGVFPRAGRLDGDDLLAVDPWIGDRDRRSEDRQLLLDAIMSATEHLMIIYSGADPRTNADRPPSVPLGELLDVLDQTATAADGGPVRSQILHRHPLQPFDVANFVTADGRPPGSFDTAGLAAARATLQPRTEPTPVYSPEPLPAYQLPALLPVEELVRFFRHPVQRFLRTRAGIGLYTEEDPTTDEMPVQPDGLQGWAIGDRMLRAHLAGVSISHLATAERLRGEVPPKEFGGRFLRPITDNVAEIADRARPELSGARHNVDINAELTLPPPGSTDADETADRTVSVVGTVAGVYGDRLVTVHYSRLGPKQRLQSWIQLLAMTATEPGPWQAITIGRGNRWSPGTSRLGPVPADFAREALADLVDIYRAGMTSPLPLLPLAAAEYATLIGSGKRSPELLRGRVAQQVQFDLDDTYRAVFGTDFSFEKLIKIPARPGDAREGLSAPSRFGALARRVWHPLLNAEELA
ncbi:exodeoxyribonuclease V subunit gamma [Microlunatus soli]|uniref:RecBCD enzyme subunit RecC n=1 Tax=Microlunatus soli TaxID=630515 RepID=A0A1H1MPF7_9ACTN|nr:exodeoxyribonuclease V subunit gamma [Microlunatus soli]SDR88636.1 DNA helicase/exodeoxyribonuclease V, gamma subunit [Microlunatus soli]